MALATSSSIASLDGAPHDSKLDLDFRRDADKRHKWALGTRTASGSDKLLPGRPRRSSACRANRRSPSNDSGPKVMRKLAPNLNSIHTAAYDGRLQGSTAREPDADVTYSFDAPAGPGHGSDVLGMAINRAVERFETRATEKLVRDEYDVVARDEEAGAAAAATAEDDEYELV